MCFLFGSQKRDMNTSKMANTSVINLDLEFFYYSNADLKLKV